MRQPEGVLSQPGETILDAEAPSVGQGKGESRKKESRLIGF